MYPRRTLRTLLLFSLASLLLGLGALGAGAEPGATSPLVISGGHPDGNFQAVAGRIRTRLVQAGVDVEVRESNGSLQNLAEISNPESDVAVALTQADALYQHFADVPTADADLEVLADVGRECAILIAGADGPIRSAADLKTVSGATVAVGREGGGPAVSWANLVAMDPGYANAEAVTVDAMETMARIKAGDPSARAAGVLLVQRPNRVSPAVQTVLSQPTHFRFVDMLPTDIEAAKPAGEQPAYEFARVTIRSVTVQTYCTRALVVVSTAKTTPEVRSELARVLLENERYIAPGE